MCSYLLRYGVSPENIILYGQSIGTVPTIDLASRYEVGAVILHSPLMSGMRVAFPNTKRTWFFDVFPRFVHYCSVLYKALPYDFNLFNFITIVSSIDKVSKIISPVLVIHGTEDEVIDFSHGLSIYEKCSKAVEPLWVEVSTLVELILHITIINIILIYCRVPDIMT